MDTSIFRYVLEVEKYRNITQAAKRLFISQPALTKQLNKLEKELGFSPFDRTHSTPIHPQRIDYVDTRYLVACSGCGIALLPHMTIRNSSTGQNPVYGTIKGDTLYRYVIVARKKGRNLSPSAEIVWRYMISASAKNR